VPPRQHFASAILASDRVSPVLPLCFDLADMERVFSEAISHYRGVPKLISIVARDRGFTTKSRHIYVTRVATRSSSTKPNPRPPRHAVSRPPLLRGHQSGRSMDKLNRMICSEYQYYYTQCITPTRSLGYIIINDDIVRRFDIVNDIYSTSILNIITKCHASCGADLEPIFWHFPKPARPRGYCPSLARSHGSSRFAESRFVSLARSHGSSRFATLGYIDGYDLVNSNDAIHQSETHHPRGHLRSRQRCGPKLSITEIDIDPDACGSKE